MWEEMNKEDGDVKKTPKAKQHGYRRRSGKRQPPSAATARAAPSSASSTHAEHLHDKKLTALTSDELKKYDVWTKTEEDEVVADKFNIVLRTTHMKCLRKGKWLNDEVINFFMQLLNERGKRQLADIYLPETCKLKYHCFPTWFAVHLSGTYSYKSVRTWSRGAKIKIMGLQKLLFPVHVNRSHWTCCVVDVEHHKIEYYDSLGGRNDDLMANVRRYVQDEAAENGIPHLNMDDWENVAHEEIPTQANDYDCGMFVLKYMDYITEGLVITFNQGNIEYFRKRVANELANMYVN
jgi:sentrin-specific protease 1